MVPSPCCGECLKSIGSRKRKVIKDSGEHMVIVIRRLRCVNCRKIHHELPDFIIPYKRYESSCIERVVSEPSDASQVAADNATLYRWQGWMREQTTYLTGCLASIAMRFHQYPAKPLSDALQSAHHRIGHYVGQAVGWLARTVRSVTNSNLWLHTRSACLSTSL